MFVQNFIKLSAEVHASSCAERTKIPTQTLMSVATADSNKKSELMLMRRATASV